MLIKVIKEFRDKTTGETLEQQIVRTVGTRIDCSDEIGQARIDNGFAELVEEVKTTNEVKIDKSADEKKSSKTNK